VIITELYIPGRPVTKGSLTRQGNRLVDTPQSKAWRRVMAGAIRDDLRRRHPRAAAGAPYVGPVVVLAAWFLPVPVTRHAAGDLDKLLRNHLDALSAPGPRTEDTSLCAGAIVDDNLVQHVDSWKFFDTETPGVAVRVSALSQAEIDAAEAGAHGWRAQLTA